MGQNASDKEETRWLVMIYMVAKSIPGEAGPLTQEANDDIQEMKLAFEPDDEATSGASVRRGASHHVRVVYQLHTEERNERMVIGAPAPTELEGEDCVVGDGTALSNFVLSAVGDARREWGFGRQADRTMLVMWGHAYRFGIGAAITTGGADAIDFDELADRFRDVQLKLKKAETESRQAEVNNTGASLNSTKGKVDKRKLDILAFDTCDLATVEMAVQMEEFARFMVASQIGMPLPGWPYTAILKRLVSPKGDPMEPAELSSYIIRRFCQHYRAEKRAVALSALNLSVASRLRDLVDQLARKIVLAVDGDDEEADVTQRLFEQAQTVLDKPFVDVAALCVNLSRYSSSEEVRLAAVRLGDFLVTPLDDGGPEAKPRRSDLGTNLPFVAESGRNACEAGGLQGISLYAPNVLRDSYDWIAANHWYEKFEFTQKQTIWYELVRALAMPE